MHFSAIWQTVFRFFFSLMSARPGEGGWILTNEIHVLLWSSRLVEAKLVGLFGRSHCEIICDKDFLISFMIAKWKKKSICHWLVSISSKNECCSSLLSKVILRVSSFHIFWQFKEMFGIDFPEFYCHPPSETTTMYFSFRCLVNKMQKSFNHSETWEMSIKRLQTESEKKFP